MSIESLKYIYNEWDRNDRNNGTYFKLLYRSFGSLKSIFMTFLSLGITQQKNL